MWIWTDHATGKGHHFHIENILIWSLTIHADVVGTSSMVFHLSFVHDDYVVTWLRYVKLFFPSLLSRILSILLFLTFYHNKFEGSNTQQFEVGSTRPYCHYPTHIAMQLSYKPTSLNMHSNTIIQISSLHLLHTTCTSVCR